MDREKENFPSELRYDLASKNWVVIASGRAKRPEMFKEKGKGEVLSKENCPFCKEESYSNLLEVFSGKEKRDPKEGLPDDWSVASISNKFPAFISKGELQERKEQGIFKKMNAIGFHEVIITRDHERSLGEMSFEEVEGVLRIYRERFLKLKEEEKVNYISLFHNHGKEAGASIAHPHSQLIATPLFDIDIKKNLDISSLYYEKEGECLHCKMQKAEIKEGKRVIYENDHFLAISPFASKVAFETVITPKRHLPRFEEIKEEEIKSLSFALKTVLEKIYKGLNNPPYNFYIQSAPFDGGDYNHYHFHITILPRTSVWAGFELGAKMEISTIRPEEAAKYLKNQ